MTENPLPISCTPLGQSGYRFQLEDVVIYFDPYLSDSLERDEGSHMKRMFDAPFSADRILDASLVLISHAHQDHCDLETLMPLVEQGENVTLIGPYPVIERLKAAGFKESQLLLAECTEQSIKGVQITAVPAAHPELETSGVYSCVGYVVKWGGHTIYLAGDTSVHQTVMDAVIECGAPDFAFIPVNEKNYMRDSGNIIGNMSAREAFHFAETIGVDVFIPTHFDMFENNCVLREEIEVLYQSSPFNFSLQFYPDQIGAGER